MDPVAGAVVIAGLTTIGKPTAEAVKAILGKILGPSSDALGEGIAAPLKEWAKRRGERAGMTVIDAGEVLTIAGIEPHPVPGRVLWPILHHSSLEDDSELHRRWVMLLARSAQDPDSVPPAFPAVLAELSPLDAAILDYVHHHGENKAGFHEVHMEEVSGALSADMLTCQIACQNLTRLGLLTTPVPDSWVAVTNERGSTDQCITDFGYSFLKAITAPA